MEFWNYIKILEQKKSGWFFKEDNVEERLLALTKILELGYPSSILALIPFLKDANKEIQQATCKVIVQLFELIKNQKDYYDTLKHCDISTSDINDYQRVFPSEAYVTLCAIAAMNRSGYVREKAVKKLIDTNDEKAIPFILYRLADWVEVVRQTALKGIGHFKKKQFVNALVSHLIIFEWLQKVERTDLSAIHADIMKFIFVENRPYVIENFKTYTDRTRILIAKQIASANEVPLNDLKILLNDKHFLIRHFVLRHFEKLTQIEIDKFLKDKSARVRLLTLYHLKSRANFIETVFPFLSDNSASVRDFARYSLKHTIVDFATIYNDNLTKNKSIVGSLMGLAEVNGEQFVENVVPYLDDPIIGIRKAAFLTLKKLDWEKAYSFALQNLDSEYMAIRNSVIDFFSVSPTEEALLKARSVYINGQYEMKNSMLKLFSKIGKWTAIADIMIGTIDENESIRNLSYTFLQQWRRKAATYFTQPKQGELERANKVFRFAYEMHEDKKYFNHNPLTGIDFYLR